MSTLTDTLPASKVASVATLTSTTTSTTSPAMVATAPALLGTVKAGTGDPLSSVLSSVTASVLAEITTKGDESGFYAGTTADPTEAALLGREYAFNVAVTDAEHTLLEWFRAGKPEELCTLRDQFIEDALSETIGGSAPHHVHEYQITERLVRAALVRRLRVILDTEEARNAGDEPLTPLTELEAIAANIAAQKDTKTGTKKPRHTYGTTEVIRERFKKRNGARYGTVKIVPTVAPDGSVLLPFALVYIGEIADNRPARPAGTEASGIARGMQRRDAVVFVPMEEQETPERWEAARVNALAMVDGSKGRRAFQDAYAEFLRSLATNAHRTTPYDGTFWGCLGDGGKYLGFIYTPATDADTDTGEE